MSQRLRTKMFEEHRVAVKAPGAAPGTWITRSATVPVDEAINFWLGETGNVLVLCGPPGIHVQWLDKEMTTRAVIVAVMVTYEEAPRERTVAVPAPAADPDRAAPPPAAEPADGYDPAARGWGVPSDVRVFGPAPERPGGP